MNSDEANSPTSPSVTTSTGRRIRVRPVKRQSISQEASLPSIPSIPSDDNETDWVSPFTLPPLPAFKKLRSQVDRSPDEKIHNRSGSSAYYAAAWGSPYATPSPSQSPALRINRNKSLDLESSPLASRKTILDQSNSRHSRQNSLPARDPIGLSDLPSSPDSSDAQAKSQRRNWLSESEDSGSELEKRSKKTPTQFKFVDKEPSRLHSHQVQASVDTITPETFNGASSIAQKAEIQQESLKMTDPHAVLPSPIEEKPLPNLPAEPTMSLEDSQPETRPVLPPPVQSFHRPKKKVPWKGKTCIIALPLTDREQAGLPPVLTAQQRHDLQQKWIDLGYPIHGFSVGEWSSAFSAVGGASRPSFPDPADMDLERKSSQTRVRIPDQSEWQAWVDYLKEEKLRALGVSLSTSEAPSSAVSPFSSTMSRVSSAYPSIAPSPPIPPMSATSMRPHMSHSPFSPSISHTSAVGFATASQRGTPNMPNGRPMHGYTQSIAIPGMAQRFGSPFDYPISQPGVYGTGVRSPDGQIGGRRPWTPGHVQNLQSMANIISPTNSSPFAFNRGFASNPQVQAIQRQSEALAMQQQAVQAQMAHHQRQMSMFPMRAMSAEQVHQMPRTPKAASPEREPPEIMHPTPRSHRHNLSAALEKGMTESIATSSKELNEAVDRDNLNTKLEEATAEELEDGEIEEEKEQEEPPILQRPETMKDDDEKAEIETNPSNAGTPMLLDEKNPFANFKPLPPPAPSTTRPGFGHAAQPSLTRLNVQAKEFSPSKSAFSPSASVFNFDGNAFASQTSSPGKSVVSSSRLGHKHNPSSLGLNVTAPVFKPIFAPQPAMNEQSSVGGPNTVSEIAATLNAVGDHVIDGSTEDNNEAQQTTKPEFDPRSSTFSFTAGNNSSTTTPAKSTYDPKSSTFSTFSFGSTSFNVEAPEFKPSGISLSSIDFTPEKPANFTSTMFGDVVITPSSKAERRAKAVPIVRPKSREGSPQPEQQDVLDAEGRPVAPVERNKRAKTIGVGDEEILFADSAPFKSLADEKEAFDVEDSIPAQFQQTENATSEVEAALSSPAQPIEDADSIQKDVQEDNAPDSLAEVAKDPRDGSVDPEPEVQISKVDAVKAPSEEAETEVENLDKVHISQPTILQQEDTVENTAEVTSANEEITQEEAEPAEPTQISLVVEKTKPALEQDISKEIPVLESNVTIDADAEEENLNKSQELESTNVVSKKEGTDVPVFSAEAPAFRPGLTASAPVFKPTQPVEDKPQSGLSALAPTFEFKPAVKEFVPEPTPVEQSAESGVPRPKKTGLMASRFAASPPPEQQKSAEVLQKSDPLLSENKEPEPLLEENIAENESADLAQSKSVSPAAFNEPSMDKDLGAAQKNALDTLERFREHDSRSNSVVSRTGDLSFEEINAVMKQFEDNPDLGIIREDTPVNSTPLIDMRYPHQFRSDAPSPSPNRRFDRAFNADKRRPYGGLGFEISGVHQLNYGGSGEVSDWNAELSPGQQDKLESRAHFFDDHVNDLVDNVLESRLAPLERALQNIQNAMQQTTIKTRHSRRSMSTENKDSDADDEDDYDAYEGYAHYRSRSPKRHDRRQEKIKAAVLEAMTVAQSSTAAPQFDMGSFQETLAELKAFAQQEPKAPVLDTSELTRTIAEMKLITQQRAAEPQMDVRAMQTTLDEIRQLASEKPVIPEVDLSAVQQSLANLMLQLEEKPRSSDDLKVVLEDVISTHPRFTESRKEQDDEAVQNLQIKINDLEAMLKVAEKRADGEASLRREAEEENDSLHRHLKDIKDQAAAHKEVAERAQKHSQTLQQERHDSRGMSNELEALRLKNEALEKTLDGYRDFKEKIKDELEIERSRTDTLARSLQDARHQHQDQMESRDVLRTQLSRLQERMNTVVQDVRHDEAEWRKQEHDLLSKNHLLQAALDHETNRRARVELEADKINKEHRENLQFRSKHDTAQEEISRLAAIIVGLQAESKTYQDAAYKAQRELAFVSEKHDEIIASRTHRLQDELDAAKTSFQTLQSDADARIARLQGQLDSSAVELQESKTRHESNMEKMFENHNQVIRRANEKHDAELEQRLAQHEEKLIDLRNQHSRDVSNGVEDRKALEQRYLEKLDLSNDKVEHLEGKIRDLEERLEISRDAARAAVIAAAKNVNLPTPASSVVASPPHRGSISGASMPLAKGSDLPEKISPQALRETIMVLQDQLQNREQKIDKLEAELAAIDKDAPAKVRERDTEIVMLRELLDVRVDDLQEVIATLEKPEYDRAAVKDAAIRLKTQIKMEQQLKERAITGANLANNLPSSITSGLANLTQSPRAMVAAAAWGNWRKVRDSSVGAAMTDFASNIGSQTPSRSSSASSSLLTSIASPTANNKQSNENSRPSTARPLAAAAAARKHAGPTSPSMGARPLRSFNSQPRTLAGARPLGRRGTNESRPGSSGSMIPEPTSMRVEPPSTPLQMATGSDFGDDVDEDASPLDGKDRGFDSDMVEELSRPQPPSTKIVSPRRSRTSSGKPVSPRVLRALAGTSRDNHVEVIEED